MSGLVTADTYREMEYMLRYVFIAGCLLCLSACYTANNERFSAGIRTLVMPGMDMTAAIKRLEAGGFGCDERSAAPATTCVKTRQSLLLSTCIERVNLIPAGEPATVESVKVPQIMCAGL